MEGVAERGRIDKAAARLEVLFRLTVEEGRLARGLGRTGERSIHRIWLDGIAGEWVG